MTAENRYGVDMDFSQCRMLCQNILYDLNSLSEYSIALSNLALIVHLDTPDLTAEFIRINGGPEPLENGICGSWVRNVMSNFLTFLCDLVQ